MAEQQTTGKNERRSRNPLHYLGNFLRTPAGIPITVFILLFATFSILSIPGIIGTTENGVTTQGFYFLFDTQGEFTWRTIVSILNGSVLTGMVVIAVVMLMIGGEFDLSVGPLIALSAYIFGTLAVGEVTIIPGLFDGISIGEPLNPLLAMVIALAVTTLLGVVNGLIVNFTNIPSFIATLGTFFIFLWLIAAYSGSASFETTAATLEGRNISTTVFNIFSGRLRDFNENIAAPLGNLRVSVFWVIGLGIIMHLVMTRTGFGNRIFAVGGNPGAARSQGVSIARTKIYGFAMTGLFAGLGGVIIFSQFLRVQGNAGNQQELYAIAGAVVGGTLLTGGYGSIIGGLIGYLTISTIRSGVVLLSTPAQNSFIPDIPYVGEYLVRLVGSDSFLTIVGFSIVGAAILNSFIRRRL